MENVEVEIKSEKVGITGEKENMNFVSVAIFCPS